MENFKDWAAIVGTLGLGTVLTLVFVFFTFRAARHIDRSYLRPLVVAHLDLIHALQKFMIDVDARLTRIEERAAKTGAVVDTQAAANGRKPTKKTPPPGRRK